MKTFLSSIILLLISSTLPLHATAGDAFPHLWSGFSTSLVNRSAEQRRNAQIAGKIINETVIPPGGLFSFNDLVGARDPAKGFVPAPNLNSQGILEEAPGGGICQLASTIYNTALLGGMKIEERHPHSRTVGHVPPGRDATISSWRKDLKLRNPFTHPLLLVVSNSEERLTVALRATIPKEFQVRIISEQSELEPQAVAARGAKTQAGIRGFTTQTRRITESNGIETVEVISEDIYPAPSRIIGE
jgi:vancomycin resistance protein VanW